MCVLRWDTNIYNVTIETNIVYIYVQPYANVQPYATFQKTKIIFYCNYHVATGVPLSHGFGSFPRIIIDRLVGTWVCKELSVAAPLLTAQDIRC